MGKEVIKFGDIKLNNMNLTAIKIQFLKMR